VRSADVLSSASALFAAAWGLAQVAAESRRHTDHEDVRVARAAHAGQRSSRGHGLFRYCTASSRRTGPLVPGKPPFEYRS